MALFSGTCYKHGDYDGLECSVCAQIDAAEDIANAITNAAENAAEARDIERRNEATIKINAEIRAQNEEIRQQKAEIMRQLWQTHIEDSKYALSYVENSSLGSFKVFLSEIPQYIDKFRKEDPVIAATIIKNLETVYNKRKDKLISNMEVQAEKADCYIDPLTVGCWSAFLTFLFPFILGCFVLQSIYGPDFMKKTEAWFGFMVAITLVVGGLTGYFYVSTLWIEKKKKDAIRKEYNELASKLKGFLNLIGKPPLSR